MSVRRLPACMLCFIVLAVGSLTAAEMDPNSLTPDEEKLGFELLFNGQNFEGWKNPGGWVIENGTFAFRERGAA